MKGRKMTIKEKRIQMLTDPQLRKKIFKELCDHVAEGYSVDCFSGISKDTLKLYLKDFPQEFDQEQLNEAILDGQHWWETIGKRQSSGDCLGNSRTWQYNMINRYGWRDKIEVEAEHKGTVNVNVISYAQSKQCKDSCEKE